MEKVKVKRYVSGKRPDYAPMESSDEEEEDFQFVKKGKDAEPEMEMEEEDVSDPRLRRLLNRVSEDVEERCDILHSISSFEKLLSHRLLISFMTYALFKQLTITVVFGKQA